MPQPYRATALVMQAAAATPRRMIRYFVAQVARLRRRRTMPILLGIGDCSGHGQLGSAPSLQRGRLGRIFKRIGGSMREVAAHSKWPLPRAISPILLGLSAAAQAPPAGEFSPLGADFAARRADLPPELWPPLSASPLAG